MTLSLQPCKHKLEYLLSPDDKPDLAMNGTRRVLWPCKDSPTAPSPSPSRSTSFNAVLELLLLRPIFLTYMLQCDLVVA